jgi:hypothetical protein
MNILYMLIIWNNYYDRKTIFYREHNQCHLTKEGNEYIVHAHHLKANQSLQTMEQLRKATYASNTPIIVPKLILSMNMRWLWSGSSIILCFKISKCRASTTNILAHLQSYL